MKLEWISFWFEDVMKNFPVDDGLKVYITWIFLKITVAIFLVRFPVDFSKRLKQKSWDKEVTASSNHTQLPVAS